MPVGKQLVTNTTKIFMDFGRCAVWMLTYLLCVKSQELGQCPEQPYWPPAHQSAFGSGCV